MIRFVALKKKISIYLTVFNEFDCNLKFTYEIENNNKINFLDVSLVKENGNIITDWYYKPMSSNRTLNYHSNHPLSLTKNIVFNLIDRAILLSDKRFHKRNISRVTEILIENSYPPEFHCLCHYKILKNIKRVKTRLYNIYF